MLASVDEDVTNLFMPMHSMFVFVYTIEVCIPGCPLVLLWCMCHAGLRDVSIGTLSLPFHCGSLVQFLIYPAPTYPYMTFWLCAPWKMYGFA